MRGWPDRYWNFPCRDMMRMFPEYREDSSIGDRIIIAASRATERYRKAFDADLSVAPLLSHYDFCLAAWDVSYHAQWELDALEEATGRGIFTTEQWIRCTDHFNRLAFDIALEAASQRFPDGTFPSFDDYKFLARLFNNAVWRENDTEDDGPFVDRAALETVLACTLPPPGDMPPNKKCSVAVEPQALTIIAEADHKGRVLLSRLVSLVTRTFGNPVREWRPRPMSKS